MNKSETLGQVAINKSLIILNAIRDNKELECKRNRDVYDAIYIHNPEKVVPFSELKESTKRKFEWHPCDEYVYNNLEFSVNAKSNQELILYRETGNKLEYSTVSNIDEIISALVDLYRGKEIYRRRNYEHDKEALRNSIKDYKGKLENETNQRRIRSLNWAIESAENKLSLKEDDERYKWYKYSRSEIDGFGSIGFYYFDYKPIACKNYKLKDLIEKKVGKIIY